MVLAVVSNHPACAEAESAISQLATLAVVARLAVEPTRRADDECPCLQRVYVLVKATDASGLTLDWGWSATTSPTYHRRRASSSPRETGEILMRIGWGVVWLIVVAIAAALYYFWSHPWAIPSFY